jgi:putative SOS response-associated peptidase YedK
MGGQGGSLARAFLPSEIYSYTIIRTTPNEVVGKVHDRMPVILHKEDEETWLNPDSTVSRLLNLSSLNSFSVY